MRLSTDNLIVGAILLVAFLIRVFPLSFPIFSAEEARIAYRGYTLSHQGRDELGRGFPLIFNSLEDYQLPLTSYLTALGILVFGKSDLGARAPFILFGTSLVYLTYLLGRKLLVEKKLSFLAAVVVAFSPNAIFWSKVPNEYILLTTLLILLLLLIINRIQNLVFLGLVMILTFASSKFSLFLIIPLTAVALLINTSLRLMSKKQLLILLMSIFMLLIILFWFLNIPQGKRSFIDNNFSLFTDIGIQNDLNKLRSEGQKATWPEWSKRLFFNKSQVIFIGIGHWLSNLQPKVYFGQLDSSGLFNFLNAGLFSKILVLPFWLGIVYLVFKKRYLLLIIPLIILLPSMFIYPRLSGELLILTAPFVALIIASGFSKFSAKIGSLILVVALIETLWIFSTLQIEYSYLNEKRPVWTKDLIYEVNRQPVEKKLLISDDAAEDFTAYYNWYIPDPKVGLSKVDVKFPYRYHQTDFGQGRLITSDDLLWNCGLSRLDLGEAKDWVFYLSTRDLKKARARFQESAISPATNDITNNKVISKVVINNTKCPGEI